MARHTASMSKKVQGAAVSAGAQSIVVKAPLPGLVLRINVSVGDEVTNGQELLVLEAMKMETPINSPGSGKITSIEVSQGDQISAGQVLLGIN